MGLYDDDDAAVTEGPVDEENYYFAKVWGFWADRAMKKRMNEASVKRIFEKQLEFADAALKKFAQHKELQAMKAKCEKIIGKIEGYSSGVYLRELGGGWHVEVYLKGWANGMYSLYLAENGRKALAKERAGDCVWRLQDSWMKDEESTKDPDYPKTEIEEIVGKAKPIAAG